MYGSANQHMTLGPPEGPPSVVFDEEKFMYNWLEIEYSGAKYRVSFEKSTFENGNPTNEERLIYWSILSKARLVGKQKWKMNLPPSLQPP